MTLFFMQPTPGCDEISQRIGLQGRPLIGIHAVLQYDKRLEYAVIDNQVCQAARLQTQSASVMHVAGETTP